MEQLVREILSVSKLEQHTFKLKVEEVNPSKLIGTITKISNFCFSKSIEIIKEFDSDLSIYTDCALLEKHAKILSTMRLCIHHIMKSHIKLRENSKQDQIEMKIINTGINIKDEDIQQIFKPFYRIENQGIEILEEVVWGYILLNKFLKR